MFDKERSLTRSAFKWMWVLSISALFLPSAWAHDFWIEPSSFWPGVNSPVNIRLFVGDHFKGDPFGRRSTHIDRFLVAGDSGETDVFGIEGSDPAGVAVLRQPGLYAIGYRSHRSLTHLDAELFESYLKEEGLESILRLRAERGQTHQEVREAFSRCAKALVQAGVSTSGADRALGFTLELVAAKNPYSLAADDKLPVKILFRGKPLSDALVTAMLHSDTSLALKARSDANGEVVFRLPQDGLWMIKAVHMTEPSEGVEADWESLWATLTFELNWRKEKAEAP